MKRLRIGEFAKLGHVSVKALRFYESEGLLQPDFVDPISGYRYYRVGQTEDLALITNLRAAGFSIVEIAALLRSELGGDKLLEFVSAKREHLLSERADIDDKLRIVEALSRSLSRSPDALSAVKLTSVASQRVHSVATVVPSLGAPVTRIFEDAETRVAQFNARSPTAPFLIFHDPPAQAADLRIEVCIPVSDAPGPGLQTATIPGCQLACSAAYGGRYRQTEPLRERMIGWIETVGLRPCGPLREVYHRFGADQEHYRLPAGMLADDRREYLTELLLPIAPPRSSTPDEETP